MKLMDEIQEYIKADNGRVERSNKRLIGDNSTWTSTVVQLEVTLHPVITICVVALTDLTLQLNERAQHIVL